MSSKQKDPFSKLNGDLDAPNNKSNNNNNHHNDSSSSAKVILPLLPDPQSSSLDLPLPIKFGRFNPSTVPFVPKVFLPPPIQQNKESSNTNGKIAESKTTTTTTAPNTTTTTITSPSSSTFNTTSTSEQNIHQQNGNGNGNTNTATHTLPSSPSPSSIDSKERDNQDKSELPIIIEEKDNNNNKEEDATSTDQTRNGGARRKKGAKAQKSSTDPSTTTTTNTSEPLEKQTTEQKPNNAPTPSLSNNNPPTTTTTTTTQKSPSKKEPTTKPSPSSTPPQNSSNDSNKNATPSTTPVTTSTSTSTPTPTTTPKTTISWASMAKKGLPPTTTPSFTTQPVIETQTTTTTTTTTSQPQFQSRSQPSSSTAKSFSKILTPKHPYSSRPISLQVRGMANRSNMCYLNVILQTMIQCPPFFNYINSIVSSGQELPPSNFPVLCRFIKLVKEFKILEAPSSSSSPLPKADAIIGATLTPEYFYNLLHPFYARTGIPFPASSSSSIPSLDSVPSLDSFVPLSLSKGKAKSKSLGKSKAETSVRPELFQQDVQEFLIFLLDLLHEEVLTDAKRNNIEIEEPVKQTQESEWQEVGRNNKSAVILTKEDSFSTSPITDIFGGQLRSIVRKQGAKASVTLQPFYSIPLDITHKDISSIEDALSYFMTPENIEGYTERKMEIQASKQTMFEILPTVLILQLKRVEFLQMEGTKLDKFIKFSTHLAIKPSLLSSERVASHEKRGYTLFSVVCHHGRVAGKGHYTTDILHSSGFWLHFDDSIVKRVPVDEVLSRRAYLLFYVRQ